MEAEAADRVGGNAFAGTTLSGVLHLFVAFDWGDEIKLERAAELAPAELQSLSRRRRTPSSVTYRPAPLRYALEGVQLSLSELGTVTAATEATLFDFGGASVTMHVPFSLPASKLVSLAGSLADSESFLQAARGAAERLYHDLQEAIVHPRISALAEEYVVFQLPRDPQLPPLEKLLRDHADWLAALAGLESSRLSQAQIAQSTQFHLSYGPDDLFLPGWSAAVLVDQDCEETLQAVEFANLQLLELRFIDDLLDGRLADAYRLIHPLARSWLPFWRIHDRPLRALGELRIEAHGLFERTGNALKLVGDQYLARVYRLLAERFHLAEWERSIERSLDVVESVYQVVSDQSATYRTEFLEVIVILLILIEIIMAFVGH